MRLPLISEARRAPYGVAVRRYPQLSSHCLASPDIADMRTDKRMDMRTDMRTDMRMDMYHLAVGAGGEEQLGDLSVVVVRSTHERSPAALAGLRSMCIDKCVDMCVDTSPIEVWHIFMVYKVMATVARRKPGTRLCTCACIVPKLALRSALRSVLPSADTVFIGPTVELYIGSTSDSAPHRPGVRLR